ncbi:MAG: SpoVG family protein [Pirellulales bacterium]
MEITEVRVKLMEDSDDRLQAFCSITFDNSFVVRDLKIIDGVNGPFVAMPSRKLTAHCPQCGYKNHLRAHYCNQCGGRLREERPLRDADGRVKLYADIAHPINAQCRELIQKRVIAEFQAELDRAREPGYVSRYDDDYGWEYDEDAVEIIDDQKRAGTTSSTPDRPSAPAAAAPAAAAPAAAAPPAASLAPIGSPAPAATSAPAASSAPTASSSAAPREAAGAEKKSEKRILSQPAAQEPRPPHTAPAPPKSSSGRTKNDQFGAGIFE